MVSEAQKRAHQKHEASRAKRAPLWLEPDDAKALDKIKRKQRLPSRIATLRWLMERSA